MATIQLQSTVHDRPNGSLGKPPTVGRALEALAIRNNGVASAKTIPAKSQKSRNPFKKWSESKGSGRLQTGIPYLPAWKQLGSQLNGQNSQATVVHAVRVDNEDVSIRELDADRSPQELFAGPRHELDGEFVGPVAGLSHEMISASPPVYLLAGEVERSQELDHLSPAGITIGPQWKRLGSEFYIQTNAVAPPEILHMWKREIKHKMRNFILSKNKTSQHRTSLLGKSAQLELVVAAFPTMTNPTRPTIVMSGPKTAIREYRKFLEEMVDMDLIPGELFATYAYGKEVVLASLGPALDSIVKTQVPDARHSVVDVLYMTPTNSETGNPLKGLLAVSVLGDHISVASTIGGLLFIDGELYGLTTSHQYYLAKPENSSYSMVANESIPQELLGLSTEYSELIVDENKTRRCFGFVHDYFWGLDTISASPDDQFIFATDWALIRLSKNGIKSELQHVLELLVGNTVGISSDLDDLEVFADVWICCSCSEPQHGTLNPSSASIMLGEAVFDVYCISLEHSIVDGDSGSWVLMNGHLCGYIICRVEHSPEAYMLPIQPVIDNIVRQLNRRNPRQRKETPTSPVRLATISDLQELLNSQKTDSSAPSPVLKVKRGPTSPVTSSKSELRNEKQDLTSPISSRKLNIIIGNEYRFYGDANTLRSVDFMKQVEKEGGSSWGILDGENMGPTNQMTRPGSVPPYGLSSRGKYTPTISGTPAFGIFHFSDALLAKLEPHLGLPMTFDTLNPDTRPLDYELLNLPVPRRQFWAKLRSGLIYKPVYHTLTQQLAMGRQIVVTEDSSMHLVVRKKMIFIKPLPFFFLTYTTDNHPEMQDCNMAEAVAEGFLCILLSYLQTIVHESDLRLAQQRLLLPPVLTWDDWREIHESAFWLYSIPHRYLYGELKESLLSRCLRISGLRADAVRRAHDVHNVRTKISSA
ncbi:hypothetical protein PVAG01_10092 [Phlyctema vagabunda]|uniref:Uncharacterized protein n=1 Tax=Phlyctema vagabunda TaxID=108571 RepID=A0ABR4P502_9HELO